MKSVRAVLAAAAAVWAALLGLHVLFGRVYLDAGFYLWAARSVMRGLLPYRDFFYVQLPVYPFVYGPFLALAGYGLVPAGVLSALLAMASLGLAALAGHRLGGREGMAVAAILMAANPFEAYCLSVAKLYSLAAFFLVLAAVLALARRPRPATDGAAMAALVLATGTRLTLAPAALALGLALLWRRPRSPGRLAVLAAIGAGGLALVVGPFLVADPERTYYFIMGIHRSARAGPHLYGWSNKAAVAAHWLREHALLTLAGGALLAAALRDREHRERAPLVESALWWGVAAVSLAHLAANWVEAAYQSVLFPLLAGLVGGAAGRRLAEAGRRARRTAAGLLAAGAVLSIAGHGWAALDLQPGGGPGRAALVGRFLAEATAPDGEILACNAVYPLSAGRMPSPGFGGAPFTYNPAWDETRCRRFHGVNDAMIAAYLGERRPAALALYPDSFALGFPGFYPVPEEDQAALWRAVDENYLLAARFPNLHGEGEELQVYLPRPAE